jgi:hypothetical protein
MTAGDAPLNVVMIFLRSVFEELLLERLPAAARVVDLRCGMAQTPLTLTTLGYTVRVVDVDAGRAARLRDEARRRNLKDALSFDELQNLAALSECHDVAYAFPDVFGASEPRHVWDGLASSLRRKGAALITLRNASVVRGPSGDRSRSSSFPPNGALRWRRLCALGVLIPEPANDVWVRSHPMSFGLLAAAERLVRRWPLVRRLGYYCLWLGVRE